uniref:Relaxin 1 n=1 Tax=Podarcis muralis TaxID=64176 RepID=A0A670K5M5_PODMU|nr:prorelaxin H1 [Podarcis muralis]
MRSVESRVRMDESEAEGLLSLYKARAAKVAAQRSSRQSFALDGASLQDSEPTEGRDKAAAKGRRGRAFAMRLRRLLPVLLLLLTTEQTFRSSPAAGASASPQDGEYAVKLCGREFIRAVIFTCGGSRWRRVAERTTEQAPLDAARARAEFLQTSTDKGLDHVNLQSVLDPELEQLQSISQQAGKPSLKDFLNLYDYFNEYVPTSSEYNEYIRQLGDAAHERRSETGFANSISSYNFPLVKQPRIKRATPVGMAGLCCNWGCTKTEISRLC